MYEERHHQQTGAPPSEMNDKILVPEKISVFNKFLKHIINGGDSACPPEPPLRYAMMHVLPFWEVIAFRDRCICVLRVKCIDFRG